MRRLSLLIILIIPLEVKASTCTGRMLNPIKDLDWSCLFPITVGDIEIIGGDSGGGESETGTETGKSSGSSSVPGGGSSVGGMPTGGGGSSGVGSNLGSEAGETPGNNPAEPEDEEESDGGNQDRPDTNNPKSPICLCPNKMPPRPGIAIGFWEPIRMVDVTKRPFCMVSMGGKNVAPKGFSKLGEGSHGSVYNHAVWHIHWYINPVLGILNVLTDLACQEVTLFDLAYLTELDPLFHDDELAFILNPEAILFANPIAQASCAADCIKATAGLPFNSLFWCAGCQGGMYPFTGNVADHIAPIQSTSLTVEKFIAKLHRQLQLWETSGEDALCKPLPAPIVKKSQYRLQTTYPVVGTGRFSCNPFGRSTLLHDSFKEIPVTGEDFAYFIWRKRNCCLD